MKSKICILPGRDKITGSLLVGTLLPATANEMKPPHNIVHMALGGRKEFGIFELLINNQKVWQSVQGRPNATCTEPLAKML
jgi:hypothetical protein